MYYRKFYFLFISCLWLIAYKAFAQDQKIADSLSLIYQQDTITSAAKFELLTDLSFHEVRDLEKGLQYADELIQLAEESGNNHRQPMQCLPF